MKRLSLITGVLVLAGSLGLADQKTSPSTKGTRPVGPCQQILNTCESAGYYIGGYKVGKGAWKNCLDPILAGQSVPGVSANPDVIAACRAAEAKRHQAKQNKTAPNTQTPPNTSK